MLNAAIERADSQRNHDVVVTAIDWPLWKCNEDIRMIAWKIHARCREILSYPDAQDHQVGASWCLRMSMEAAAAHGAEFLVHLADDVLLLSHNVDEMIQALGSADYIGSNWGLPQAANSQVFACRVARFVDFQKRFFLINPIEFSGCGNILEGYLWHKMNEHGLDFIISEEWAPGRLYYHSHDVEEFLQKAEELRGSKK